MTETITCPNCQYEIEVHAAAAAQMRDHIRKELEVELRRKEQEIAGRDRGLRRREEELEAARVAFDTAVQARVAEQLATLSGAAVLDARTAVAREIDDLRADLTVARAKLDEAQAAELALRKQRRGLEDEKRDLELAVTRVLDEEREKLRAEGARHAIDQARLRDADKERLVADLRRQIEDMKRTAELGSQQAQGETLEVELESVMRLNFPGDSIEAVPRGTGGGDILQSVYDSNGRLCGTIIWEAKRTKNWNDTWLPKLREDQRNAKAHIAAILSAELPKSLAHFGCVDGVWITNRGCLVGLAGALRLALLEAARARDSLQGKLTKVDLIYQYIAGTEFHQRVEGITESFVALKDDLESEKRSLRRIWAKRERHLERAVSNTAALYGELGGIVGSSLPRIAHLELEPAAGPKDINEEAAITAVAAADSPF